MEMDSIHIYSVFISVDFDPGLLASSVGNIQAAFAFHPLLFLPVRLFLNNRILPNRIGCPDEGENFHKARGRNRYETGSKEDPKEENGILPFSAPRKFIRSS